MLDLNSSRPVATSGYPPSLARARGYCLTLKCGPHWARTRSRRGAELEWQLEVCAHAESWRLPAARPEACCNALPSDPCRRFRAVFNPIPLSAPHPHLPPPLHTPKNSSRCSTRPRRSSSSRAPRRRAGGPRSWASACTGCPTSWSSAAGGGEGGAGRARASGFASTRWQLGWERGGAALGCRQTTRLPEPTPRPTCPHPTLPPPDSRCGRSSCGRRSATTAARGVARVRARGWGAEWGFEGAAARARVLVRRHEVLASSAASAHHSSPPPSPQAPCWCRSAASSPTAAASWRPTSARPTRPRCAGRGGRRGRARSGPKQLPCAPALP
jgi:hypothetical protein